MTIDMTSKFYNLDKLNICYFIKEDVADAIVSKFDIFAPEALTEDLGASSMFSGLSIALKVLDGAEASFYLYLNDTPSEVSEKVLVGEFKIDYKNSNKIRPWLYSHIVFNNKYLYTYSHYSSLATIIDYLVDKLSLELHQVSSFELALDTTIDCSMAILGAIRDKSLTTIQLGHKVISRDDDLNAIGFEFFGNSDCFTRCAMRIRKKEGKAKNDKQSNAQLYGYNKTLEVKKSNKQYILDTIGITDATVYRLEVRMDSHTINNYLNSKYKKSGYHKFEKNGLLLYEYILNPNTYETLFNELSSRFIRFRPKRGKIVNIAEILSEKYVELGWSQVNGVHSQTLEVVSETTVSKISYSDYSTPTSINTSCSSNRNNKQLKRHLSKSQRRKRRRIIAQSRKHSKHFKIKRK